MKLELGIMAGDSSKQFLVGLTQVVDRLEKVARILRSPEDNEEADDADEAPKSKKAKKAKFDDATDEEEEAPKKSKKATFDDADESEEEEIEEEDDAEEEDEAPKKSAKGKKTAKVTIDDVNDACMARATRKGSSRKKVLAILQNEFEVQSVTDLDPSDYGAAVKAMGAK